MFRAGKTGRAIITRAILAGWLCVLAGVCPAWATEYFRLALHERVQASDTIVLAHVVDPGKALVHVDRVLKGEAPSQITLVNYVDGFLGPAQRKALLPDARELLFLRKASEAYAPVQNQNGRLAVDGDRLIDSYSVERRSLSETIVSIERLVTFQGRAARGDVEADRAYVAAFASADAEAQTWALGTASRRVKVPSPALADALLARWPKDAGAVANAVVMWRLRRAAPLMAKTLTTSGDGDDVDGQRWRWVAPEISCTCPRFARSLRRMPTQGRALLPTTASCTCWGPLRLAISGLAPRTHTSRCGLASSLMLTTCWNSNSPPPDFLPPPAH